MRREPHTPREDLADGPLGLAEHAEEAARLLVGEAFELYDELAHQIARLAQILSSGACGSEQAGDGDGTSFNNTSLTKEDCCQALTRWLRELDLNQRFQGESLAN